MWKKKYCTARQTTDVNTIRRMRFPCWIPKATNTHSEYVILIDFPRQQWLRELASLLLHSTFLVSFYFFYLKRPRMFPSRYSHKFDIETFAISKIDSRKGQIFLVYWTRHPELLSRYRNCAAPYTVHKSWFDSRQRQYCFLSQSFHLNLFCDPPISLYNGQWTSSYWR